MHETSDAQLLRDYADRGSEAAFRELVTRHTDFVYSAAVRQVDSPDLAGDIAQSVFTDLARKARPLAEKMPTASSLAGWLHRSTRYAALNHLRDTRRRLAHERQAMEQLLTNSESAPDWERIRPALDEALDSLADEDREAILLRYFKNHDFRVMGLALGISDDTAQKRVSRAVERLREFFAKRGVTVGASGLVVVISANAVQAAPVGLAVTISTAAAMAGTTIASTATATAVETIAMTTLQKTLVTVFVIAAATTPLVLKQREVTRLRKEVEALRWEKESLLARQPSESTQTAQVAANPVVSTVEVAMPANLSPAEVVAKIAALLSERKPMDKARMEAWAKLMAQVPPDQMDQAIQAALQLSDREISTGIVQTLFRNWVEANPRAALAFATVKFQGQEKSNAIRDALQRWAAQEPEAAFAAWREQAADPTKRLSWGGDRQANVTALFEGMAQQDFQKAVGFLDGLDRDLFGSALQGMGAAAAKTEQGREFFLKQLDQVTDLSTSGNAMTSFFGNWSQYDLTSATKWLESQPTGKLRDAALRQIGISYVRRNPKEAADWWLTQATTPGLRSDAIFCIAQEWASKDVRAAGDWLTRCINQHQGDSEDLDGGRSAFAEMAVWHEPLIAMQWAESIIQPSLRNPALVRTWQKWRQSDRAAAEQFLAKCNWPAALVAQARGNAAQ